MMLKLASWNIEGRLSPLAINRRGTPEHILREIERLDADIIFLTEAFEGGNISDDVRGSITKLGYTTFEAVYEDGGGPRKYIAVENPSMMLLSRLPLERVEIVRPGDLRNMIVAHVALDKRQQTIRIIGVHLDDRSEEFRLRQADDLASIMNSSDVSTIVMGDCNAMYGTDLFPAKLLQSRFVRALLPAYFRRVSDMARGSTLQMITETTGCHDADVQHHLTATPKMRGHEWLPSIRLIGIDHMLLSAGVIARDFQVSPDGGSDHRAISAMITLDKIS